MSHELRTPLNSIVGFSEILAGDGVVAFDQGRWRDYARLIRGSGRHLLHVVNDLLDFAKIEAGMLRIRREAFPLAPLVLECADLMRPQAMQRSVAIVVTPAGNLTDIRADRRACRQILLNLLSNAVEFSPAGGEVRVVLREVAASLRLSVGDRGIGVAEGDSPRLGLPFFQVDSAYNRRFEGTGLDLAVVKGLVSLHGGELAIASEPGVGTTVTVSLPKAITPTALRGSDGAVAMAGRERKSA